ncbi:MAG: peptide ABC transporter substrate-binding protein [Thermodesulfobacteriota bacterium]
MKKLIILLLFVSVSAYSCTNNSSEVNISEKDTLNINIGTEPPSLDGSLATDSTSYTILNNIMDGLTKFSHAHKPEPALAEFWEISEDGKTYTFKLRDGVVWSDGVPLRAQDFFYSWNRILDPDTAGDYAYFLFDIKNAEEYNSGKIVDFSEVGVKALDDKTLQVELRRPASYFPSVVSFMSTFPLREDIIKKHGQSWTEPGNIVTIGPYKLTKWKHHDFIILEENQKYWGVKPKNVKKVKMIMNENPTSSLALYESGELDFLDSKGIPVLEVPRLVNSDEFINREAFRGSYVAFNVEKPPFDNPLVRKAFASAIDRKSIVGLIQGAGIPATSWIPKNMLAYNPDIGVKFDPEKGRELLSEAGFPGGKNFPKASFLYPDVGNNRIVAEALQSMWKKHLGVKIKLDNQEWKVYLRTRSINPPEIARGSWGADFPDPHNFMNLFECKSGNNHTNWCNPEYDRLVESAAEELDENKRIELYDKAQKILTETDVPIAPYINSVQQNMIKPFIKGLEPDPLNLIYFNRVEFVENNQPLK